MASPDDIVRVSVPMTREARDALTKAAKAENLTVAELMRESVDYCLIDYYGKDGINFGVRKWGKYV